MPPRRGVSAASSKSKRPRIDEAESQPTLNSAVPHVRSTITFQSLPLEIRVKIYEISFANVTLELETSPPPHPHKRWAWDDKPQLELTSKQIWRECLPVRQRMTTLTTCFLAVYKPFQQQAPELPTAFRALPRPVASTLTHLFMTKLLMTVGPLRYLREFDIN